MLLVHHIIILYVIPIAKHYLGMEGGEVGVGNYTDTLLFPS